MSAFVIHPAEDNHMMVIGPYEDRTAAKLYAGLNGYVVESEADVIWTGTTLVEVYNAVAGKSIKKFESRAAGVKRLLEALPTVAREPAPVIPATKEKSMSEGKRGRQPKYKPDMTIKVLTDKNPFRAGTASYSRVQLFQNGQTVQAFVAAGGRMSDIHSAIEHDYISVA